MRILERGTLDLASLEKLLGAVVGGTRRRPAPVVCIECYRDGGCREHSRPEEKGR